MDGWPAFFILFAGWLGWLSWENVDLDLEMPLVSREVQYASTIIGTMQICVAQ